MKNSERFYPVAVMAAGILILLAYAGFCAKSLTIENESKYLVLFCGGMLFISGFIAIYGERIFKPFFDLFETIRRSYQ